MSFVAVLKKSLLLVPLCCATAAYSEPLPKLELGVGAAVQHLGDYRGSSEEQTQGLPFPFLIYRGERLRADRDGIRGRLFHSRSVELNVSGETALNGDSEDNKKREGMPELDSALEFGPSLNINLSGYDFHEGWSLRMPVRAVFTVSTSGFEPIGYNFNPKLTYRWRETSSGWKAKFDLGALWATEKYHAYYYDVAEQFATEGRPVYSADGGFSGTYFKLSLKKRSGRFWYAWALRYDNIGDTVFADSPLVETDHYYSTAIAVGWMFWRSETAGRR